MPWATIEQVQELTSTEVTDTDLAMAQGIIELYSGATEDMDGLSVRDLRHLKMAVAYQTKWMVENPEIFGRTGVSSFSEEGLSFTLGTSTSAGRDATTEDLVLAILAKDAIKRLSWRGSRSMRVALPCGSRYATWEEWRDAWLRNEVHSGWSQPGFHGPLGSRPWGRGY
jgi:hypothetical protein